MKKIKKTSTLYLPAGTLEHFERAAKQVGEDIKVKFQIKVSPFEGHHKIIINADANMCYMIGFKACLLFLQKHGTPPPDTIWNILPSVN
jgi:hypothetical protein